MDPELRYRKLWLSIGCLLIALVVYLSLTSAPLKLKLDLLYQDKFGHLLAYFAMMFWFAQIYHGHKQRLVLMLFFVLLGVSMECLQSFDTNRYAEIGDMVANILGVLIAVLLALTPLKYLLLRFERVFIAGRH